MLLIKSMVVEDVPDHLPVVQLLRLSRTPACSWDGADVLHGSNFEVEEAFPQTYRTADGREFTIAMTPEVARVLRIPREAVHEIHMAHDRLSREHTQLARQFHDVITEAVSAELSHRAATEQFRAREAQVKSLRLWQRIRVLFGADPFSFCS